MSNDGSDWNSATPTFGRMYHAAASSTRAAPATHRVTRQRILDLRIWVVIACASDTSRSSTSSGRCAQQFAHRDVSSPLGREQTRHTQAF